MYNHPHHHHHLNLHDHYMPQFVNPGGVPPGSVMAFAGYIGDPVSAGSPPSQNDYGPTPPAGYGISPIEASGWMVCDGRLLSCNLYPTLFLMLGFLYNLSSDTYHVGDTIPDSDKNPQFRIPDYRGYFLRAVTGTSAIDPDSSQRKLADGSSSTGIGSIQQDAMQTHQHAYALSETAAAGNSGTQPVPPLTATNALTTPPTDNVQGTPGSIKISQTETRAVNMYVYYIIKYA